MDLEVAHRLLVNLEVNLFRGQISKIADPPAVVLEEHHGVEEEEGGLLQVVAHRGLQEVVPVMVHQGLRWQDQVVALAGRPEVGKIEEFVVHRRIVQGIVLRKLESTQF